MAAATGAPSGTLYHRFGSRAGLLADVWLRTVAGFQAGYLEALEREPILEACVGAARHVITWSRTHGPELRILLRGPGEFEVASAPEEARARIDAAQAGLEAAWERAAARLPGGREDTRELVVLTTVELPYAVARRHLRSGRIPARADVVLQRSVRAVVTDWLGRCGP